MRSTETTFIIAKALDLAAAICACNESTSATIIVDKRLSNQDDSFHSGWQGNDIIDHLFGSINSLDYGFSYVRNLLIAM